MISAFLQALIHISVISHGISSFTLNPTNVTACQDSPATFHCQITGSNQIFWIVNDVDAVEAGLTLPPTDAQTHLSTLIISKSSSFSGARIMCYYILQPSGFTVYSDAAFLTVIGPSTTPSLVSYSVNHTAAYISWSLPPENQISLSKFSIIINNRNGILVYNVSTLSLSLIFNIPDPCDLYDITVSAIYKIQEITCIKASTAPLSGAPPSVLCTDLIQISLIYPMETNQMQLFSLNISFPFQPDVCTYMITARTANQVITIPPVKPLVFYSESTINVHLAENFIYNLSVIASNRYGNTTTHAIISSFDVVNVTIVVSPSTGLCEVICSYNSGFNAQGCLVYLKHAASNENYCISLYNDNTFLNGVSWCNSSFDGFLKKGMYLVNAYDIEKNWKVSAMPAVMNAIHTCEARNTDAEKQTNYAAIILGTCLPVAFLMVIGGFAYKKWKNTTKTTNSMNIEEKVAVLSLHNISDKDNSLKQHGFGIADGDISLSLHNQNDDKATTWDNSPKQHGFGIADGDTSLSLHNQNDDKASALDNSLKQHGFGIADGDTSLSLHNQNDDKASALTTAGTIDNMQNSLMVASKSGDIEQLKLLLNKGVNVNQLDEKMRSPLMEASLHGHKNVLLLLLDNGANIDQKDKNGRTAFHEAAINCHKSCLTILASRMKDWNIKDNTGNTALHYAAESGHRECVRFLTNGNAIGNVTNQDGDTPLHLAALHGRIQCIKEILMRTNADVNAMNNKQNTALHCAALHCCEECITYLLDHGSLIKQNNDGDTPLHLVSKYGSVNCIRKLTMNASSQILNACNKKGLTALHRAVVNNNRMIVDHLLQQDEINVNIRDTVGQTALHIAAINGHDTVIKSLIEIGNADTSIMDNDGDTPLHLVSQHGSLNCLSLLTSNLSSNALNACNKDGRTALHLAAMNDEPEIIKHLLDQSGIDVNIRDSVGQTALHIAAINKNDAAIKCLIANGKADTSIKDNDGYTASDICHRQLSGPVKLKSTDNFPSGSNAVTPVLRHFSCTHKEKCASLHIAADNGCYTCIKNLLQTYPAIVNEPDEHKRTALHIAAEHGYVACVRYLLKSGSDIILTDEKGLTALHYAAQSGIYACVKTLLKSINQELINECSLKNKINMPCHEAADHCRLACLKLLKPKDVDIQGKNNNTMLHYAARHGWLDGMKYIIDELHASVDCVNDKGHTPLHQTAKYNFCECAEFLLQKGCDVHMQSQNGSTALYRAAVNGNTKIVQLLLDKKPALVNVENNYGDSPLNDAAGNGLFETVTELLKVKEINVNKKNKNGNTALHHAAAGGHTEVVIALCKIEVDLNTKNTDGNTPLHRATIEHHVEVIKYLLTLPGIDVTIKNEDGNTALDIATEKGEDEIIKILQVASKSHQDVTKMLKSRFTQGQRQSCEDGLGQATETGMQ